MSLSIVIGAVTTGATDSHASVTLTGTSPDYTLNPTIPAGRPGCGRETGTQGADAATGATGVAGPAGARRHWRNGRAVLYRRWGPQG